MQVISHDTLGNEVIYDTVKDTIKTIWKKQFNPAFIAGNQLSKPEDTNTSNEYTLNIFLTPQTRCQHRVL